MEKIKQFLKWFFTGRRDEDYSLADKLYEKHEAQYRFVKGQYGYLDLNTGYLISDLPNKYASKFYTLHKSAKFSIPEEYEGLAGVYIGYIGDEAAA